MKKSTLLTVLLALSIVFTTNAQNYSGGAGTSVSPYKIANLTDLQYLSVQSGDWALFFVQTADIDASETNTWNIGDHDNNAGTPDEAMGFSPIGVSFSEAFTGSYNGQGHIIDALYINRTGQNIGLFGVLFNGGSIDSLAIANVNITGNGVVGGLVGVSQNSGIITNSLCTGIVSGSGAYIGGLAGRNYNSTINNCYSLVSVNSTSNYVGGFVGYNTGSIDKCYSAGSVSGNSFVGGLVGDDNSGVGTTTNSFYNNELSGQTTSAGGTGLNTEQMQQVSTYADSTWDFMVENVNGTEDIWGLNSNVNNGHPFLSWQGYSHTENVCGYIIPQGDGTEVNPYEITTLCDLKWLSKNSSVWDKYFIQTVDIDASETNTWNIGDHDNNAGTPDEAMGFSPIGVSFSEAFTGSYNGQGHIIDALYINRTGQNIGLFGVLFNGGSIDSLAIANVNITGNGVVGGLVGVSQNSGIITNSLCTGIVSGSGAYIGGLAGRNYNSTINNCYSLVSVNSTSNYVGGFVGYNTGSIDKCYSAGSVSGNSFVGGLVGDDNSGVGTTTNSFYNNELSGQTTSAGGTELNTEQMQSLCRYIDAGWDFMSETDNGNDDIWGMNMGENNAYPFLAWQSYTHTATLTDDTPPTITCVSNQVINLEQGETSYIIQGAEFDLVVVYDNCNIANLTNNLNGLESLADEVITNTTTIIWTVTDATGNENTCTFDVIVNLYVGLGDLNDEKTNFSIYPNPAKKQLTIYYSIQSVENIQLLDIEGRIIEEIVVKQNNTTIDVSSLKSGIYFIKVENEVLKFVKE